MIWGLSTETFTLVHVIISLVGIATGFVVIYGFLVGKALGGWNAAFLATTIATSVTGFAFPFTKLLPAHYVGFISLAVLAVAVAARYGFGQRGRWRGGYVVSSAAAQYLNVFVLVVQAFLKIAPIKALAPTQNEPPFAIAQGAVLVGFVALTVLALRRKPAHA